MASTRPLQIKYSSRLDSMTAFIKAYLSSGLTEQERARADKGIKDFCFNNSDSFKKEFLEKIALAKLSPLRVPPPGELLNGFIEALSRLNGECIFLLKDTQKALEGYQKLTSRGYGLLINRKFLCDGDEERYFELIQPIYEILSESKSLNDFIDSYYDWFKKLITREETFREKAISIYKYVHSHHGGKPIFWVDFGFQYTFILFAFCSVRHFGNNSVQQDFYSFTTYPWLQNFFKGKYFSEQSELALKYELEGIKEYYRSLGLKASGTITGFAIGDALGFPVAGIDKSDLPRFVLTPVTDFIDNKKHPYFSDLVAGQYTDNTTLMKQTADNLVKYKGFNLPAYVSFLIQFGKTLIQDANKERWLGPTAFGAIKNLMAGTDYQLSGSTSTSSCSASYRIVPLAIYYKDNIPELINLTRKVASITHNSPLSKDGAVIISLLISELLKGVLPEEAIRAALRLVVLTKENRKLIIDVRKAVSIYPGKSVEYARRVFGTGSPIYQTLPLAIFYFLKYQNDFEKGLIAAANSYRISSWLEKRQLAKLSWDEQLIAAKGGNSDGIAALTGALLGAHLGLEAIPVKFKKVENFCELTELGKRLVE